MPRPTATLRLPLLSVLCVLVGTACVSGPADRRLRHPSPERLIAMGDLHGDLEATRAALRLGGAIDQDDRWIGGDLVVVQTGDILDRGDDEEAIIRLFQRLEVEAREPGGAVHVLNGNHELMNAYLDFRYVTPGGFEDFEGVAEVDPADSVLAALEPEARARAAAFLPGGPMARILAERNTMVIVGSSLFVHGGVLPEHVEMGLAEMNGAVRAWLRGEAEQPEWIRGDRSPVWTRLYSRQPDAAACDTAAAVLAELGLERMVMGHTVHREGITPYCEGLVWAIDVGMADHYGGPIEVLEIRADTVVPIR